MRRRHHDVFQIHWDDGPAEATLPGWVTASIEHLGRTGKPSDGDRVAADENGRFVVLDVVEPYLKKAWAHVTLTFGDEGDEDGVVLVVSDVEVG